MVAGYISANHRYVETFHLCMLQLNISLGSTSYIMLRQHCGCDPVRYWYKNYMVRLKIPVLVDSLDIYKNVCFSSTQTQLEIVPSSPDKYLRISKVQNCDLWPKRPSEHSEMWNTERQTSFVFSNSGQEVCFFFFFFGCL